MALKNHATKSTTALATTVSPDVTGLVGSGDILVQVANMGGGGGATLGWSSGFGVIGSLVKANIASSWGTSTGGIQGKVATGSETTLANTSTTNDFLTSSVIIFSGRSGTPFATTAPVQQNTVSAALPVAYSVATGAPIVAAGTDILLIMPTQAQAVLGDTLGFTAPSGWTLGGTDYARNPPTSTDTAGSPSICWAYFANWPGGALPANLTGTITNSGGHSTAYTAYLVFMDPAVVVTSPLVGQTTPTSGGSGVSNGSGQVYWLTSGFVAYASGTMTGLNCYCNSKGAANNLLLGLYDQNGNLIATTASTALSLGLNALATLSSPAIVYGQTYYPAWQADGAIVLADDNTAFKAHQITNTYGSGLPSAIPIAGGTLGGVGTASIWATGVLATGAVGLPLGGGRTQMHWR